MADCDQFTVMIGLVNISEEYITEDATELDLTIIKERIIRKVLNINNYIKSLCDYYDKKKKGVESEKKLVKRNEFFVYSVCISFNPKIKGLGDLNTNGKREGDGVCTVTVKLPKDTRKQSFYLKLMLKCISKNAVILKMNAENTSNFVSSKVKSYTSTKPVTPSAVLKPIPKYFDENYSDDEATDDKTKEPTPSAPLNAFSFFNQSSLLLSKYATSNLVLRDEDKYVSERLLKEKNKARRR